MLNWWCTAIHVYMPQRASTRCKCEMAYRSIGTSNNNGIHNNNTTMTHVLFSQLFPIVVWSCVSDACVSFSHCIVSYRISPFFSSGSFGLSCLLCVCVCVWRTTITYIIHGTSSYRKPLGSAKSKRYDINNIISDQQWEPKRKKRLGE